MTKEIYMGTSLPPAEHRAFKIVAAQEGLSIAAYLRKLALSTVPGHQCKPTRKRKPAKA